VIVLLVVVLLVVLKFLGLSAANGVKQSNQTVQSSGTLDCLVTVPATTVEFVRYF
jgi:hypothetical protein